MGNCFDAPDDWTIRDEARSDEMGAGWLKKQGKSRGNWSKRFFSLTDSKLVYYTDETRTQSKGEIMLVGASVRANDALSKKKFFVFTINHPILGARELSTKTALRREQWLTTLTNVITALDQTGAMYGTILKKGGLRKNEWQERWCVLSGNTLTYFENQQDSLPKGCITVTKAQIREYSAKDQKFCFEIIATGKKGTKKYGFCVDGDSARRKWLQQLKKASNAAAPPVAVVGDQTDNPLAAEVDPENDPESGFAASFKFGKQSEQAPKGKEGFLMKKSPSIMTGWQKRYFVLKAPGNIHYYENVSQYFERSLRF
jgi:hypothetical protein